MGEHTTPEPQLNRAGRRAEARRLRKTGALLAAFPAAMGTTAAVLGATTGTAGAATTWTVTKLADTNDGDCAPSDCSLREALDEAVDGDTIVFDTGLSGTIDLNTELVVDYAVDIQGPGAATIAVDGQSSNRIFYLNPSGPGTGVTISGLTLKNGFQNGSGGAILVEDADLVLTDVVVSDNTVDINGGAVFLNGSARSLTITGSTFTGNSAAIDGGAIFVNDAASLTVTNSNFAYNSAEEDDGGAIAAGSFDGAVTVTGSTFTGNEALGDAGYGGAIYVNYHGGAFTITGSTFTGNSAAVDGGAVFDNEGPSIAITDSTFTGNSVAGYDGGAVGANSDVVTITGSTFSGNSTNDEGGAVYVRNPNAVVTVTGSTFTGNATTGYDGDGASIAVAAASSLTITGSTFMDNTAYSDAGGVFVRGGEGYGPAVTVTGSTFTGNVAQFYDGAAIAIDEAQSVLISFTTIANNTAGDQGGGLYFDDVYEGVTITNSTISGNQTLAAAEFTYGQGGGVFAWWVYDGIDIDNSTISGNTGVGDGGGVFLAPFPGDGSYYTSSLRLTQSTVTANVGTTVGGVAINDEGFGPFATGQGDRRDGAGSQRQQAGQQAERVHATGVADPSTVTLDGTIVALNAGADLGTTGTVVAKGSLWGSITGSTLSDLGGNLVGVDPKLGLLQDNGGPTLTHELLPGSPAINTGPDPVADFPGNDNDQRGPGYPRVVAGRVDIGAFEVQPTTIEPTFTG